MVKKIVGKFEEGSPNLWEKKEENTTIISLVLGVGMSSPFAGRHWSTSRSGRNQLTTSLRISFSSTVDFWNISEWEAAMAREKRT
jgi:hypothetical protein